MPVRKLDDYLAERSLIQEGPLSMLRNQRLGVEGMTWIKQIAHTEPFHVAVGGPPLSLTATVLEQADKYRANGLKPLFVFNGLAVPRKDNGRSTPDLRYQLRISGWEAYYKGEIERAAIDFQNSERNAAASYVHLVMAALESKQFDCMRAPLVAWSQLAYFARYHAVSWCVGSSDLLLAGCERVVLGIDFVAKTFKFVELRRVLDDLGSMTADQFTDACILAGFDYCATFPTLLESGEFGFRAAAELVQRHRSGQQAIAVAAAAGDQKARTYIDVFLTARALVRHALVLEFNTAITLLHRESVPRDIHDVVGHRLPDEIYYLISIGALAPPQINALLAGVSLDAAPLVDSLDYRRMLDLLMPLRSAGLAILSAELNEFFATRRVVAARWFEKDVDHVFSHQSFRVEFGGWHPRARGDLLVKSAGAAPSATLVDVCRLLAAPSSAPTTPMGVPALLTQPQDTMIHAPVLVAEAVGAPLVKLLVVRGFAMRGSSTTIWGAALALFSSERAEQAMLFLELLRLGYMHGRALEHIPPEQTDTFAFEREVLLLTRTFSLLPATLYSAPWEGPLDHDLLGFNSIVKLLHRALRNVLESELAARVLRREFYAPPQLLAQLARLLPFVQECNTALGIVLKHMLLQSAAINVADGFPNCGDIRGDLMHATRFWSEAVSAVRLLHAANVPEVSSDVYNSFVAADNFLRAKSMF